MSLSFAFGGEENYFRVISDTPESTLRVCFDFKRRTVLFFACRDCRHIRNVGCCAFFFLWQHKWLSSWAPKAQCVCGENKVCLFLTLNSADTQLN